MPVIVLLLVWITSLATPTRETAPAARVFPSSAGLIFISSANDGIAVAADGASFNADGTVSQAQKLFPVGKAGAVAIAGSVSIQDPVTRPVREEVNVSRIAAAWLDSHPDATLDVAAKEINAAVAEATAKYFSTRPPGADMGGFKFALIFSGLADGKPVIKATRYYMPLAKGKAMHSEPVAGEIKTGQLWILGQSRVAQALLANSSPSLAKFRAEVSIRKLHSSRPAELTAQDYVNAFDAMLRATESNEGRKMIVGKAAVAPPNKLAIISKDGFAWSKAQ